MDIVHLLPDSVANQIAAGEVVQRPASVVKELMENAIDAGAKHIQVVLKNVGKAIIQVIDDGKGMSNMDARMAFERHATSKIASAQDLFSINTLGFRGEALPSIASVSEVELKTRQEEDELGTSIFIAASELKNQESVSCPKGTNISVRNLFYNIPARRKFLKSDTTELRNITFDESGDQLLFVEQRKCDLQLIPFGTTSADRKYFRQVDQFETDQYRLCHGSGRYQRFHLQSGTSPKDLWRTIFFRQ